MRFTGPTAPFRARVAVPGDKSMSHRALFLAAMAAGRSRVRSLGPGADVESTRDCLRALGIVVEGEVVSSPGVERWEAPIRPLDAGNSATTMRMLAGAVAGRPFTTTISGDESLMRRPMARLAEPLRTLGADVAIGARGRPPVVVTGAALLGVPIELAVPSAQVRTATALAALQASGATTITSPPGFRDHTERWLHALGLGSGDTTFEVRPGPVPPFDVEIPADPSSAAFLWVGAAIAPRSVVVTEGVSLNAGRVGLLEVLEWMGAGVRVGVTGEVMGDPVGDVQVTGAGLRGVEVRGVVAVRILDELPALAVAAAHAEGITAVGDAAEARTKESDRIAATVAMINDLGGRAREQPDGFEIDPVGLSGGTVDSRGDHRIAMAAAVAAGRGVEVVVEGFGAAAVSWPGFERALEAMWSSR